MRITHRFAALILAAVTVFCTCTRAIIAAEDEPAPVRSVRPVRQTPVAESLDDYFARWLTLQPPRPPELSPFYLPFEQIQDRYHATSLITNPDDARTLARAAEYVAGATLIDHGARGTQTTLTVMGVAPAQSLWTVDGARASQPDGGFALLAFAGYSGLQFASDRYSDVWHATGRVLNLATPNPGPYTGVNIGGGAGSQGVFTEQADANWNSKVVQGVAGEAIEYRRENSHDNSQFAANTEWLNLRVPVSADQTLFLKGQRLEMRRGWYESNNIGLGAPDDPNDTQLQRFEAGSVESLWQADPSVQFHLALHGSQQLSVLDQVPDALSFTDQRDKTTTTRAGLRAQLAWLMSHAKDIDLNLTASLIAESESYKRPFKAIDKHGQLGLGALAFDFNAKDAIAFHVDVTAYSATDIDLTLLPAVALIVPLFPRGMLPEERFDLTLRGSRNLTAPSYEQRYLNDFTLVGNPDLKPALSELWQAILRYESPFYQMHAEYDHRHFTDEIVTDTSGAPFTYINRDGAQISAFNFNLRTQPLDPRFQALSLHFPFFFDWTWTDAQEANGDTTLTRPKQDIKIGQEIGLFLNSEAYRFPDLHPEFAGMASPYFCRFGAQWHYRSGWHTQLNEPDVGPFATLDGFVSITPRIAQGSHLELRLDGQNLTNRKKAVDLGYDSEGFLWVASLRAHWLL